MLNFAGPEYDFGSVVYAVLQDCEHRRRVFDDDHFERLVRSCAKEKLAQIKASFDEFGGSPLYWDALQKEVLDTVVPQYVPPAHAITKLERNAFDVWRQGDLVARFGFALVGLLIGSIIIAVPFIPIVENMFAFALTGAGFIYPDLKRFMYERRFAKTLNKLINDSAAYQESANLQYLTATDIRKSVEAPDGRRIEAG